MASGSGSDSDKVAAAEALPQSPLWMSKARGGWGKGMTEGYAPPILGYFSSKDLSMLLHEENYPRNY